MASGFHFRRYSLMADDSDEIDLPQDRLVLMRALEASLQGSREALLALDLAGIELRTSEQTQFIRRFAAILRRPPAGQVAPAAPDLPLEGQIEKDLRRCEGRILNALRLQSALLARARSKLRVIANVLAGPSAPYGPGLARGRGE